MADSYTIHVDGIGRVFFERSTRAKHVVISIRPFKGVRVAIPTRVSLKQALEFVNLKKLWIQKHLVRIKQMESQRQAVNSTIIDKVDAKKKLTSRLDYLAAQHGLTYNKVTIRNQKARWGSCSYKNNISLNIKLAMLSDELVDYVILHELAHTKICNHSKRFWGELDKYVGDGKAMAKRLKEHTPS